MTVQTASSQGVPTGCFERRYSQAHLAAHPAQGVAALQIHVANDNCAPGELSFFVLAEISDQGQAAETGAQNQTLAEGGICRIERGNCFVDGDGGGFDVIEATADTLTIETRGMRLIADDGDTAYQSRLNESLTGATRYHLSRVDDARCMG